MALTQFQINVIFAIIGIVLTIIGFFLGKAYVYYYGDYKDIKNNKNCIIDSTLNNRGGDITMKAGDGSDGNDGGDIITGPGNYRAGDGGDVSTG
jgi:hypothetical protein